MTRACTCTLPGRPESARAARELVAACLPGCPSVYEAMLCADELVANAVTHSRSGLPGGTVTVRVITQPGQWFRVEVEDGGPRLRAVPGDPGPLAEHGRGLALVEVLADAAGHAAGLAWFMMAWHSEASAPEPRPPAHMPAELRIRAVLDRSGGMCQCSGQCGRDGHRCGIGEAPGRPLHIVAGLVALCAACRAGRDRVTARPLAAAAACGDLSGLAVKP